MNRAGQRIITLVQNIATRIAKQYAPQLFYGEVKSTEPLKIRIDDRYEVGEAFLLLDSRCVETRIRIPQDDNYEHTHTMEEMLVDMQAMSPAGPVTFAPAGEMPPFEIKDPDNPDQMIPNPDLAMLPAVLGLRHAHTINKALEEILLWRGLEKGDKVKVLRISTNLHYVLERVEGVTNDPS